MMRLETEGAEEAQRLLVFLGSRGFTGQTLMAGGRYLKGRMEWYPRESHRKNPDLTPKQRRYLAMAVRKGWITIPYRRTYGMRAAWEIALEAGGMEVVIRNRTKAARYTIGRRTNYHRVTGWRDLPESWVRYRSGTIRAMNDHATVLIERYRR